MKIPTSIRIGGVEYAITSEANPRIGNKLVYGKIDYDNAQIVLSDTDGYEHQRRCITLWHEILHAIREHNGMEIEEEERVVEMFARGLYQVLQDNGGRLFDLKETTNG